jgi:hypothetical protein
MLDRLIILPLSSLIGFLFKASWAATGNYGVSLLFLSVLVSLITFPLQLVSDWLKAKDDSEKAAFAPVLADINARYSGAERYYYTRYLNKLYGYHPIKSMRSLGGVIIQLPFFIGAYHFLSGYDQLLGQSFACLRNLGKPDALLFGLNALPLAMTAINILASAILLDGKPAREKGQLYLVAVLFLFLLYESPSALVLYWTFNNVFAFLRIAIPKIAHGERLLDLAPVKNIMTPPLVAATLCAALFSMPSHYRLARIAGLAGLCALCAWSAFRFIRGFANDRGHRGIAILSLCCVAAAYPAYGIHRLFGSFAVYSFYLLTALPRSRLFPSFRDNYFVDRPRRELALTVLACVTLPFLFFMFAPVAFASSDPLAVDGFLSLVASRFLPAWLASSAILCGIGLALPARARRLFLFAPVCAIFVFTLHGYFLTGTYGQMDGFAFAKLIIGDSKIRLDAIVYMAMIAVTFALFARKFDKALVTSLAVIFVSGFAFFAYHTAGIIKAVTLNERNESLSAERKTVYSFSKTEQNVLVIMLDRAFGFMTETVFERNPDLRDSYDGFVYYPNCVSHTNSTVGGFLSIMGGYDYEAKEVMARDHEPISKKAQEAFSLIPLNLRDRGYDVLYSNVDYDPRASSLSFEELEKIGVRVNFDGNRYVLERTDKNTTALIMLGAGLFRLAGDLFRKDIYRDGTWLIADPDMSSDYALARKYTSQLRALPAVSDAESDRSNFILLHNLVVHNPYAFGANGEMFKDARQNDKRLDRYPAEDVAKFGDQQSLTHYYGMETGFRLINDWFAWMKANGVYDNTKIIVVSDHGREIKWAGDMGTAEIAGSSLRKTLFVPLLMVKDFGAHGTARSDMTFMTNADVPRIALSHLDNVVNPVTGKPLPRPTDGTAEIYHIHFALPGANQPGFKVLGRARLVGGDIYDDANWSVVSDTE